MEIYLGSLHLPPLHTAVARSYAHLDVLISIVSRSAAEQPIRFECRPSGLQPLRGSNLKVS